MIGKKVTITTSRDTDLVEVTILDKVNDIRAVTIPTNREEYAPIVDYFVITKYLVCDSKNDIFTIYTHQIKHLT
jgi:hypothetical protein